MPARPGTAHVVHAIDRTTLVLEGEHDLSTRALVERAIATAPPRLPLVIDLRLATFVDVSIAALVQIAARSFVEVSVATAPGTVPHRVLAILEPRLVAEQAARQAVEPEVRGAAPSTNISTTTSDSGST